MLQQQSENKCCSSLSLTLSELHCPLSLSLPLSRCTHKFQLTILPLIWQKQQKVTKQQLPLFAKLQFEIPPTTPARAMPNYLAHTLSPHLSLCLLISRLTVPIWQTLSSINYDYRHVLWDVCPTLWLTQGALHSYNEYWQRICAIYILIMYICIQGCRWQHYLSFGWANFDEVSAWASPPNGRN